MAKADDPPPLDITLPKLGDVNPPHKNWEDIELPIEVVLLTVKDYEFLSCYSYLENVFRSYRKSIGRVYFGEITAEDQGKVKISLVRCSEGATGVGAALNVIRNAVSYLKPKAVICVGFCGGLNPAKAKLGDVVISAKISTYAHKEVTSDGEEHRGVRANVSRHMGDLIRYAAVGWKAPLKSPGTREVKVHCNGEILSGPELVNCDVRREKLREKYETAIAIDMEGEGMVIAQQEFDAAVVN